MTCRSVAVQSEGMIHVIGRESVLCAEVGGKESSPNSVLPRLTNANKIG